MVFAPKRILAAAALTAAMLGSAAAQDTIKIGLITPLTGPFTTVGQEMQAAAKLYMQHNGDTVAGKKIELIVRDDGGVPDNAKRIAQELIVNDKVSALAGMGLTPIALAIGPLATQAKIPLIVMGAATSTIPASSPFIVRTSFAAAQPTVIGAQYFARTGVKNVVTLVTDFAPGIEIETWFKKAFEAAGGKVTQSLRVPIANPDFAPFLQRVADAKPEALMIFVPSGQGATLMRQFVERGPHVLQPQVALGLADVEPDVPHAQPWVPAQLVVGGGAAPVLHEEQPQVLFGGPQVLRRVDGAQHRIGRSRQSACGMARLIDGLRARRKRMWASRDGRRCNGPAAAPAGNLCPAQPSMSRR